MATREQIRARFAKREAPASEVGIDIFLWGERLSPLAIEHGVLKALSRHPEAALVAWYVSVAITKPMPYTIGVKIHITESLGMYEGHVYVALADGAEGSEVGTDWRLLFEERVYASPIFEQAGAAMSLLGTALSEAGRVVADNLNNRGVML